MRPLFRLVLFSVLVWSPILAPVGNSPSLASEPSSADQRPDWAAHPELRAGELFVDEGGVGAQVPPPGFRVSAFATRSEGSSQTVVIETSPDGSVFVRDEEVEDGFDENAEPPPRGSGINPRESAALASREESPTVAGGSGECDDDAFDISGAGTWKKGKSYQWYFRQGSATGSGATEAGAIDALRDSTTNITNAYNNCGIADAVDFTTGYAGSTTTGVNINTANDCLHGDGLSVTNFGTLTDGFYALTCKYDSVGNPTPGGVGTIVESDMKLNKAHYLWVANIGPNCDGAISIRSIGTHERGHTFGLGHVALADHPNLTMINPVPLNKVTCTEAYLPSLGYGDILGLFEIDD